MKVLFVSRKFPPSVGGMERYASDLYESLTQKVDIHLIKWGGSNKALPIVLPVFFVRSLLALLIKKIDIIHIQDGLMSPMGVVLKFIFRKPLVVVIHGLDVTFENGLYQKVIPKALKQADRIICISNAAREEVLKRGVDADRVVFIPLGITDDLFMNDKQAARKSLLKNLKLSDDSRIILSVGRLVERKGVHWFIKSVMPELVKKSPGTVLLVAGTGEYEEHTIQAIREAKMNNSVRLLGRVSDKMIKDLYNGSDVFIMPNITVKNDMEGFGRVLLEAACCELPVVAAGIEGIKDAIIDGKNGVLVGEKQADNFVANVLDMLPEKAGAKSVNGKKWRKYSLDHYNWGAIADMFIVEYEELI